MTAHAPHTHTTVTFPIEWNITISPNNSSGDGVVFEISGRSMQFPLALAHSLPVSTFSSPQMHISSGFTARFTITDALIFLHFEEGFQTVLLPSSARLSSH